MLFTVYKHLVVITYFIIKAFVMSVIQFEYVQICANIYTFRPGQRGNPGLHLKHSLWADNYKQAYSAV